jgi:hypothetical protein
MRYAKMKPLTMAEDSKSCLTAYLVVRHHPDLVLLQQVAVGAVMF